MFSIVNRNTSPYLNGQMSSKPQMQMQMQAQWVDRIRAKVRGNILVPAGMQGNYF